MAKFKIIPATFRAYTLAQGTQSALARDEDGQIVKDESGEVVREVVESWPVEEVFLSGELVEGVAAFDAGATVITRVVVYGPNADGEEAVAGTIEVGRSGAIEAALSA